jgi:hypothetical protein
VGGFNSEIDMISAHLALAMETNRVYLYQGGMASKYGNEYCLSQKKHNMECYFEPLSKCTLKDAMLAMSPEHLHKADIQSGPVVAWTKEEDEALTNAVFKYGNQRHWHLISEYVGDHRTDLACKLRWEQYLKRIVMESFANKKMVGSSITQIAICNVIFSHYLSQLGFS